MLESPVLIETRLLFDITDFIRCLNVRGSAGASLGCFLGVDETERFNQDPDSAAFTFPFGLDLAM